jgi:plasmid stabilization system protein ParE
MGIRNSENQETYSLVVNDKYFTDLRKILDFIAIKQNQPVNAIKISIGINAAMNKIVLSPTIYAECENIPTKSKIYREAVFKTWRIIFKIKGEIIMILRVISGKRKPSNFRKLK